ncbi:hypothetical protein I6E84_13785 [Psychrobacter sp. SCQQ22]|uniref:DUF6998 domain-containing protein n=1 Tax=Psychrobacter sp. SCQQ22 TaxID=2792059 RepID=UPI0018CF3401|nr:hypothetical protein [Psychrobacter sp. SCQQ22]MBH0087285.1 hypothetical protein [Psychrobacter sp. SCQQ22]
MLNLDKLKPIELLRLQASATAELKRREIVRTNNNPLGDYTEWLVANTMDLELTSNSKAGYDAVSNKGLKFQIKGRRVTPETPSRQLSAIRNYAEKDFDWLIAIIFDKDFNILNAYIMPHSVIGNYYPHRNHVNARVVVMSGAIIKDKKVVEITEKFRT